jgi:hypothetical protein
VPRTVSSSLMRPTLTLPVSFRVSEYLNVRDLVPYMMRYSALNDEAYADFAGQSTLMPEI